MIEESKIVEKDKPQKQINDRHSIKLAGIKDLLEQASKN
jgi:hypothetical protein